MHSGDFVIIIRSDSEYYGQSVKLLRKIGLEWIAIPIEELSKGMRRKEIWLLEKDVKKE